MKGIKKILLSTFMVIIFIGTVIGCGSHVNVDSSNEAVSKNELGDGSENSKEVVDNLNAYLVETLKLEGGTDWGTPNPFWYLHPQV